MKIYISGKVTGLQKEQAVAKFDAAEQLLRSVGFDKVVNPLRDADWTKSWDELMVRDIKLLFPCDAIYMQADWLQSTGAQIEYDIAVRMKKTIWFESNMLRTNQIIQTIKNAIHSVTGLHFTTYATKSRKVTFFYARMMFAWHCRQHRMTLVDIGRHLRRDHSSILYLINKYESDRQFDPVFRPMALKCEEILAKK